MKTPILILLLCTGTNLVKAQESVRAAFGLSLEKEKLQNYSEAIAIMKPIYDPSSYEMNMRMGWLHYLDRMHAESIGYYQKACALMPYSIEAKLGLINPASSLNNWDIVVTQYKKILEIDPQNTTANYYLGYIEYNRKNYTGALPLFEKVVNLYPFGYDGMLMLAWTNLQLGKTREASVLFNKVLLLSPVDASANKGLSMMK